MLLDNEKIYFYIFKLQEFVLFLAEENRKELFENQKLKITYNFYEINFLVHIDEACYYKT